MKKTLLYLSILCLAFNSAFGQISNVAFNSQMFDGIQSGVQSLKPVKFQNKKQLHRPGKIYSRGNFLYINDINRGVHIVDNSVAEKPTFKRFISIPGNMDVAIKDEILYADSYDDLVVVNLQTEKQSRIKNVFPKSAATNNSKNAPKAQLKSAQNVQSPSGVGGGVAASGSMARFSIVNEHLYVLDEREMKIFDISRPWLPQEVNKISLQFIVETLFSYGKYMYIGGQEGVYIYDISNPCNPIRISLFTHAVACDPVVVQDNIAYITLRTGSRCRRNTSTNQLDIVDVSNPSKPKLLHSHQVTSPKGLAVDGNLLYLCNKGIELYEVQANKKVKLLGSAAVTDAQDVLLLKEKNLAIVVGSDGIHQFKNINNQLYPVSVIRANKKPTSLLPAGSNFQMSGINGIGLR